MEKKKFDMNEINLDMGDYVQDEVTKKKGTITGITYFLTGCKRYSLAIEGEKGDSIYVEIPKVLKKTKVQIDLKPFKYQLGDEVKDLVSGLKFVIIRQIQDIGGYNRYVCRVVKPKNLKEIGTNTFFEEAEIELVSKNKFFKKGIDKVKENVEKKESNHSPIMDSRNSQKD